MGIHASEGEGRTMFHSTWIRAMISVLLLCIVSACSPPQTPPASTPQPTAGQQVVVPTAAAEAGHEAALPSPTAGDAGLGVARPVPSAAPAEAGFVRVNPNLASAANGGKIVSVTDEHADFPAARLIDGHKLDFGEWWTNEGAEFPQAVVFALAGDQAWTIDRVVLNPWTSEWRYGWVKDFEIYASTTSPDLEDMGWVGSFTLEHFGVDQEFNFDPVRARYVALVVTSHWGSEEGLTLNEFEVYEAPAGTMPVETFTPSRLGNLAAADNGGQIVDYSSEDSSGDWSAEHLIDGEKDTNTCWSSSQDLDDRQYVVFALGGNRSYLVDRVVLYPYSDQYEEDWIQDFELMGSDLSPDLDSMVSLGEFRLEQVAEDQAFTFEPVELRFVALVPLSNHGGTEYALNEFEVYEVGSQVRGKMGGLGGITVLHRAPELVTAPVEHPPESPPELQTVATDLQAKLFAASGASPLDNIEFQIEHNDLLPVFYHLYGSYFDDLVLTTLTNHNTLPAKLRIESTVQNYTDVAVNTITLGPGESLVVKQNPPLLPQAPDLLHSLKNASLHVQIDYLKEGEKRLIYEGTEPLTIYSRDDFAWDIPGFHNGSLFLAAMVTPNDPALDDLLREAADYSENGIIRWGYGEEDDGDHRVWYTMKAVYEAVSEAYDVIYVATGIPYTTAESEEEGLWLQRLKLPYEVLQTHSGMCVEISLLFASVFEKLFLDPVLITVPGHVYLGVPIAENSNTYYFLESTLVGRSSFEEAVQSANESFMEDARSYIAEDRKDVYFWIEVKEARQEGIWPIPWR